MYASLVCRSGSRPPTLQVWARLALAALVLAFSLSIALCTGLARADDDASAVGESHQSGATTSQQSDSADSASDVSVGPTEPTDQTEQTVADADPPDAGDDVPPSHPPGAPVAEDSGGIVPDVSPVPDEVDLEETPVTTQPADGSGLATGSDRPALVPSAVVESGPTVTPVPRLRSVGSPDETADLTPIDQPAPADATPPDAARADIAHPGTTPVIEPRLGRQLAGGVSDVGTIVVSVVHAVATAVAQAFGPDSFLGVPYLLATVIANTAAAVGRNLVGASPTEPTTGQVAVPYGLLDGLAFFNPTKPPAGANDPSVGVTAEHPLPVILLNSTVITQGANWSVGAPVLANAGYKVYTFNYGNVTTNPHAPFQSIGDIRKSGLELAAQIDRVLAETGAPQVILIGHSQGGGALPSYYINNLGGADKVSQLIGIGPGHHGTNFNGLVSLVLSLPVLRQLYIGLSEAFAPAIYQQSVGSPFLDEVYGSGDTRPGVLYTTISTAYDEVATPYTLQALDGPNVTNIVLQHRYPGLLLGHLNMVTSTYTWATVLDALASNPAANPVHRLSAVAA